MDKGNMVIGDLKKKQGGTGSGKGDDVVNEKYRKGKTYNSALLGIRSGKGEETRNRNDMKLES